MSTALRPLQQCGFPLGRAAESITANTFIGPFLRSPACALSVGTARKRCSLRAQAQAAHLS